MKKMNYSDFSCGSQWEHKTVAAVVVSSPALLLHKSTQDQPHFCHLGGRGGSQVPLSFLATKTGVFGTKTLF